VANENKCQLLATRYKVLHAHFQLGKPLSMHLTVSSTEMIYQAIE